MSSSTPKQDERSLDSSNPSLEQDEKSIDLSDTSSPSSKQNEVSLKLFNSSPEQDDKPLIVRRKRASTLTKPVKQSEGSYDVAFLEEKLGLVKELRSSGRVVTPVGARELILCDEALSALLRVYEQDASGQTRTSGEEAIRQEVILRNTAQVRMWLDQYSYRGILGQVCYRNRSKENLNGMDPVEREKEMAEFQKKVINLFKLSFYTRYGDALQHILNNLRKSYKKVPQRLLPDIATRKKLLQEDWTTFQERLDAEMRNMNRDRKNYTRKYHPGHELVYLACDPTGLKPDEAFAVIKAYSTRNEMVHADIARFVKSGALNSLAKRLHSDVYDIDRIFSPDDSSVVTVLQKVLRKMIKSWYTFAEEEENNPEAWVPSKELLSLRKDVVSQKIPECNILNQVYENIRAEMRASMAHEFIDEVFDLGRIVPTKRAASRDLCDDLRQTKRRAVTWDHLRGLAFSYRSVSAGYILDDGELRRPLVEDDVDA